MKLARWRQLESLYNKALEMDESRRAEFLREACAGDRELQHDVERLLAARPAAASFLEQPALQEIAHEFAATAALSHQYWIGRQVGNYQFVSLAGAGGMGEVYRARDTKLKREVAIKVIPDEFSRDPERISRFQREAQLLASLNHPNIAAIYDLEELNGSRFLILEMVEGETLADQIQRGPIPVEEALKIALQIAEALEAAHEKNVIHRDLKPANIKVTAEGTVKVLDFGLAKALADDERTADDTAKPPLSMAATSPGLILGTAAYMSPEQAKGRAVDRRTDIFAFGAVLYEILTGGPAFDGKDVGGILASVIEREPDWSKLPSTVPFRIRELLRRCLEKDPKKRRRDAGDLRLDIVQAMAEPAEALPQVTAAARPSRLVWMGLAVAAAIVLGFLYFYRAPETRPLVRLRVDLGPDALAGLRTTVAISPDGTRIAFPIRGANGDSQLATRLLSQATPTPLPGTENAADPFFSPDGQWIGFSADRKLKKVSVLGGAAVVLCDAPDRRGGAWGEDGNIFAALALRVGLSRISAAGGTPQPVTKLAAGEATHRWPQILPGGQAVLFTASANATQYDAASIQSVSLKTGEVKTLVRGSFGRYVNGQLVYVQQGVLFGVPFDLKKLELRGTPAPLLDDVANDPTEGGGQFDFSQNGMFVYRSGKPAAGYPVVWLDSSGKTQPLVAKPGMYYTPRVSPDGRRLALSVDAGKGQDIYAYDIERDAMSRLTFDGNANAWPLWTPDGKHIIYASLVSRSIWWIRADGAGEAQRLLEGKNRLIPDSLSPDGRRLAYTDAAPDTRADSWTLPLDLTDPEHPKPGKPEVFLKTPAAEGGSVSSPDGRWIAYASEQSGRPEVYVRPFQSSAGGKWQISTAGGVYPFWSRAGRELYFLSPDNHIMLADYTAKGDSFEAGKPRVWSETPIRPSGKDLPALDLAPDGKRFAVFPRSEVAAETGSVHVTVLLNFLSPK